MPGAAEGVSAGGGVVARVGRSRVIDHAVEPVREVLIAMSTRVARHVQIVEREIDARVQLPETLPGAEPLQICSCL